MIFFSPIWKFYDCQSKPTFFHDVQDLEIAQENVHHFPGFPQPV